MHRQAYTRWLATAAALMAVAACGGGEKTGAGASTGATTGATTGAAPAPSAGATTAAAPGGAAAAKPITGKTWDVKMIGDATGYRYDPKDITIKQGDGIKWTVVSTPPHDVSFWPDSIPPGTAGALEANMTNAISPLVGPLLMNAGDTYTMSFAGVPAGTYKYYCTPHLALGMRGTITVQ